MNKMKYQYEYDLGRIMRRAWDEYRKDPSAGFGAALRGSWEMERRGISVANAKNLAMEWAAMQPENMLAMLRGMVIRAARNVIGYSVEDHYSRYVEGPAFSLFGHALDEYVSDAWIRVEEDISTGKIAERNRNLMTKRRGPETVASVAYGAALKSIAAIHYADSKHAAACIHMTDNDGDPVDYIGTMASSKADDTERSATLRADIAAFAKGRDLLDRKILELMVRGYTERQIAELLPITNVAVHKRIVKMREALYKLTA